jgi:uncharacterized protein YbaR (Trm112 family)
MKKCPQCKGKGKYMKTSSIDKLFSELVDCRNCKRTGYVK